MTLNVYAYYDQKQKCFCTPMFTSDVKDVTLENVKRLVLSGKADFAVKDFSLYYLGVFDDVAGILYGLDKAELLAHLIEFVPSEANGNV